MSDNLSIKQWVNYYLDHGVSEAVFSAYLTYIKKLNENNCPIIFEFEHLSSLVGINRVELGKIVNSSGSYYRSFNIPKRKGGKREISSPYPSLLQCQKWIYKNILIKQDIHDCAHGFVPGRSIISNASQHLSQKALLKMDLKEFFPSISINWVINYFSSLGYAKNVSFYLASLCCFHDHLGQGSATSPYLTNILLKSLDERLSKLSISYHLKYTRYADDLTFSGDYIPHAYISLVASIIDDYGLKVNPDKTRLHIKPGQKIVTGISVSGSSLKLPRKTRREIRKEVHFIKKYGFLSHANKRKIRNPDYLESLAGKLQFWLQIEQDCEYAKEGLIYVNGIIGL